jgi:hypothetical protein
MIGYQVHLNAFAYLSGYGQSDCGLSRLETSRYTYELRCGNIVLLTVRFLDVTKSTTRTALSLLVPCELSFPIVGLKMSFLHTLALKSPNKIFVWYLRNLSTTLHFSVDVVLHIISFILRWGMNIQNNNMKPSTLSIMYDILSLTNSPLLTADMVFLCTKNPVPNSWFSFPFP